MTQLRGDQIWQVQLPCLLRSQDDGPDAWCLITEHPKTELRPNNTGVGGPFLPEILTVTYADGTERCFNPEDWFEVKPT
jgi:hypothetical protein